MFLVKLIVIFIMSNGDVGTHIGPISSFADCLETSKKVPAALAQSNARVIAAVCVPPQNIEIMAGVQT